MPDAFEETLLCAGKNRILNKMNEQQLNEAIERYIGGEMAPDERVYFEQLRKANPEVDSMVVEHTLFLQQLDQFGTLKNFKAKLAQVHTDLAQKGQIQSPRLEGRARVVYLFNRYKRIAAIAASIAGITALSISILVSSLSPVAPKQDIATLNRKFNELNQKNIEQDRAINRVARNVTVPGVSYKSGGTGFLVSTQGYLVTNAHVIDNAANIAVQSAAGKEYSVKVVFKDIARDLAILKITDSAFNPPAALPYSIKKTSAEIAEPIYTLGFPRNDIVYGEGYLAAKTGYKGDTLTCQIAIAANPGNSGGPILNRNGEVVGVLSAKQTSAEGVVFATQARYIHQAISQLREEDTAARRIKIPAASALKGADRMQQVKKIADFIYMVKVS